MITLDDDQKKAIYSSREKSLLVLAPPGAGKTLVMAKRIEFLIRTKAIRSPYKILGLTFSNSAADEMKKRVIKEVSGSKGRVHITNFHSFAYSVLKAYGNRAIIKRNFSVLGELDSEGLIIDKLGISGSFSLSKYDERRKAAQKMLDRYKIWKIERILKLNGDYCDKKFDKHFEAALNAFKDELRNINALDFDHILYYSYILLKNNENILNYYRSVFQYILVDEFQDTNPIQFKLLELLANGIDSSLPNRPVFILADPNQGIYEFQGANPKNIEDLLNTFNIEKIELKGDHRFGSDGIKKLIDEISNFIEEKTLSLSPSQSDKPVYCIFDNKKDEAHYIHEKIKEFKDDVKLHEIAILSPQGYNLDIIKKRLNKEEYIFLPDFKGIEIEKKYKSLFNELKKTAGIKGCLEEIIIDITKKIGIEIDNDLLQILINIARKYDNKVSMMLQDKILLFSNEVLLEINWGDILRKEIKNKIFLSTIHSAKGLEFQKVIVCGIESGSLPFFVSCNKCNEHGLDENSWMESLKLLNVGVSRAKLELLISSSNSRRRFKTHPSCVLKPFYRHLEILNTTLL
ncbi:ATP-dependent helicase [Methanobacterium alkalithermotolerans]|uniref:DNA 3'-5' helicase n=1 Tax=Methanobacterium alkalithermotolerans TaxID=2731220 RepID=A0A8T8K6J3_9EURY|nr:ATP-dependent helicase [Methanobacterium alkalithermotolerans]QUH24214.1 ATP-dependent helicase [Methanobacterium alkalithermotolerans]